MSRAAAAGGAHAGFPGETSMAPAPTTPSAPSKAAVLAAFAAVYVIWGSTYLAIRFAIGSLPPFLMAAVRFVVAGALLYAWARWRGEPRPRPVEWRSAAIVGGLLLCCGNGAVVWSEQHIDSGLAALLVSTVPLWIVTLDTLRPGGLRPRWTVWAGIAGGLLGLVLLIGPRELAGAERADPWGMGAVFFGALAWAAGSLYSRNAPLPASPRLGTGMEMMAGGVCLAVVSLAAGEPSAFDPVAVTLSSWAALAYLVVFGALIAFSAYTWLLRVAPAEKVATYAYINPVVALILGWALAGEELNARTLIAAAVILGSVFLVVTTRRR